MRFTDVLAGTALLYNSVLAVGKNESSSGAPQFHNSARHAGADPYAFYDATSGQYYVYSTEGADEGFNFAIYSSPDLSTWHKQPGGVFKACFDDEGNPLEGDDGQACWARDWLWAPEGYHNAETGWYFFFFAGRLREDLAKDYFRYSAFEEPSKIGVAVSRSPTGPFREIESRPIDYYPFDPDYHDINLIMDDKQMLPPPSRDEGETAPKGTFIPTIDPNIFFDEEDGRIYLYTSRNAYRNWNWDADLGKYIEESNIIVVELERDWWDDPDAATMPEIVASQRNVHAEDAPQLPCNITAYNGTGGELGNPPRKDGWQTIISYGADPQEWENFHVNDYAASNGTKKDRRWAEGSTTITRPSADADAGADGKPVYLLLYSANNYEASNYGVGFATASSPLGPFHKSSANPVLSQRPDPDIPIYSTGHGSVVASPPRSRRDRVGAQDVTHRTPDGSELFYIHHARNATTRDRSIYTTRLTLDESAVRVGAGGDGAVSMHLTPLDQPLPRGTYPITLDVRCSGGNSTLLGGGQQQQQQLAVRVLSKTGAPFDLAEDSNRVVALPGAREAVSVTETEDGGSFVLGFGEDYILRELAYQRLGVDGSWFTVVTKRIICL